MIVSIIGAATMSEAEQTETAITGLIVLLLAVAGLLTVLTIWYWFHTSPRRQARTVRSQQPPVYHLDQVGGPDGPPTAGGPPYIDVDGPLSEV